MKYEGSVANKARTKTGKRCALCRKPFDKRTSIIPVILKSERRERRIKLEFDKKECILIFEKLRRYYGDELLQEFEMMSRCSIKKFNNGG